MGSWRRGPSGRTGVGLTSRSGVSPIGEPRPDEVRYSLPVAVRILFLSDTHLGLDLLRALACRLEPRALPAYALTAERFSISEID